MTITSDSGVSGCQADVTPWGSCLWPALDVTVTHSCTHDHQSWNNTHANTHAFCTWMPTQEHVFSSTHQCRHTIYREETSQGNQADRSKSTHTGMNLSERLKIYQRMFFLKTNYPCGCVKGMTTAVSSSYQESTDHTFFSMWATCSVLDIQNSFSKERNNFKNKLYIVFSCQKLYVITWHPVMYDMSCTSEFYFK